MTEVIIGRRCSEAESKERMEAYYDYCITNRLIAYGEHYVITPAVEEEIERRCKEQYEKDIERIRRKYEGTDNKPRKLSAWRNP
jgi:hypothetical protein